MKVYEVRGTFLMARKPQKFSKQIASEEKSEIAHKIYSILGSEHGTKRKDITIEEIKEISVADLTDPLAIFLMKKQS